MRDSFTTDILAQSARCCCESLDIVVSSEGTNERAIITQARKHAMEVKAVENFKKKFDYVDPDKANTGIAFLVVCDMLLTGFDAPIEQVMYIDKRVKDHNLLQTIARVNRIAKGKTRGYIVDYVGLTDHLKNALSIYAADDQKDVEGTLTDIAGELPVLEARYQRLLNLFVDNGVAEIEDFVQQRIKDTAHELAVLVLGWSTSGAIRPKCRSCVESYQTCYCSRASMPSPIRATRS